MDVRIAQASSGAGSSAVPRIVRVVKPSANQTVTIELGYDQKVKLDLTAIADEKPTLVHLGDKLIILFDNRSTVTIEFYFDSMNVASPNVTFEVSPGRVVGGTELATLFSIATDQSVLPDAGTPGAPPAPASGADFSNASVEPLDTPDRQEASGPLPLLSQEFQPNGKTNFAEPTDAVPNRGGAGSDTGDIDTVNPTVTVDIVYGALNDGDTSSVVTFAFSEAPGASFTESDIQVSAGLTLVAGFSGVGVFTPTSTEVRP